MIRRATSLDEPWMIELGGRAFSLLGDYRMVLPAWLEQPSVSAWVEDYAGLRRGFTVIGFFEDAVVGAPIADLLALAVEPSWQRRGLGRALLHHAVSMVSASAAVGRLAELRLCVADDNLVGQQLYRSTGFSAVTGEFGCYANGQRAIRMVYPLR